MNTAPIPSWFTDRMFSSEQAMEATVVSGTSIGSNFATGEPFHFYQNVWDFIQKKDLRDLKFYQGLFMAPHKLCVGDALQAKGLFDGITKAFSGFTILSSISHKANAITQKLEGLKLLVEHYKELTERRIVFVSGFIGPATNIIVPNNAMTTALYPKYVDRNTSRLGITDMHSIHFPDAAHSLAYRDGKPRVDTFVVVMTPPNEEGELSLGPANGVCSDVVQQLSEDCNANLLLYLNPTYPFVRGWKDAPNSFPIDVFRRLAEKGKLFVVEDDSKIPSIPAGSLKVANPIEESIAHHVVNHMEVHRTSTFGRTMEVGFGGTGIWAIRTLKESAWRGRCYTEMLEPFTLDLLEGGQIQGSHFIEKDGMRTQLDGKIVCTFSLGEEGSDFYQRLNNNEAIVMASANRVVIPEGFYGGLGINNILSLDFHGHVNAGGRYRNHHSGVGGAAMIHRGLMNGGISYLCMKSTYKGLDGKVHSAISPYLPEGSIVTHTGPDLMGGRNGGKCFLVTEYGVTEVSGRSQAEFIRSVVSVSHPDFREELREQAFEEFRVVV